MPAGRLDPYRFRHGMPLPRMGGAERGRTCRTRGGRGAPLPVGVPEFGEGRAMNKTLVVFAGAEEREALKRCGVMPAGWFPCALDMESGRGERVWLWPFDPAEDGAERTGEPEHPGKLLGLACETEPQRRLAERRVAKLFGAWVVHLIFLENGSGLHENRTGVGAVWKRAAWVRRLGESIRYWFADEQAREIRHLAVVVARGGPTDATEDDINRLEAEIDGSGAFTALYYADYRIETEHAQDSLSTACLWPVMAGRLLLRFLVALDGDNPELDGIFAAGVHLWKSGELLFEYPEQAFAEKLNADLPRLYQVLERGGGGHRADETSSLPQMPSVFPNLPQRLRDFGCPRGGTERKSPEEKPEEEHADVGPCGKERRKAEDDSSATGRSWHGAQVEKQAEACLDDGRWEELRKKAREDFIARERVAHAEGGAFGGATDYAVENAFRAVAKDPHAIEGELEKTSAEGEDVGELAEKTYAVWLDVVAAEKSRREALATLEGAAKELVLAQRHYVTAPYGAAAAVAVSMACGYALFWLLWVLGGSGTWPLAAGCAALVAAGAFAAWKRMAMVHGRAGQEAYKRFAGLVEDADRKMDLRHGAAAGTVIAAETAHRHLLREAARTTLERLLRRVWRIVRTEVQSPPLDATWRAGEDTPEGGVENAGETAEVCPEEELDDRDQLETYLGLSRWTANAQELAGAGMTEGRQVEDILQEVGSAEEKRSFTVFWRGLCDECDRLHQGNFPATVVIPKIREWISWLVGSLVDARQRDFRDAIARAGGPHAGLLPAVGVAEVRRQDPYTWASAHVDEPNKRVKTEHLFIFHKTPPGQPLPQHPGRVGNATCVMVSGLSGLPQAGLYFVDILIHGFERDGHGKLVLRCGSQQAVAGA